MISKQREFEYTYEDFDILRSLSNKHSGIIVPDDKFDMFYSRLSKRLRFHGLKTFRQYCEFLQASPEQEFTAFINAVTTNLTSFFREQHHFEYLRDKLVPELLRKNQNSKKIRVWSAGCSTGEEPYSLAMTLLESVPVGWDIKILATDLDTQVLEKAASGIYQIDRVSNLEKAVLKHWFRRGKGSQSNKAKIVKPCRDLISFKQLNLMQEWTIKSHFDFIFCRNVLIYFDRETKQNLVQRYAELLKPGSCLFIGHSESLHQVESPFQTIGQTIYKKTV